MSRKSRMEESRSFEHLAELVKKAGVKLKSNDDLSAEEAPKTGAPASIPKNPATEISEETLFMDAMDGVHRVSWRNVRHPGSKPAAMPATDTEREGLLLMQAAMDADSPMPIPEHPEYIEGWVGVAGRKFLPKLRNGLYSIQGQIDLHGLNRVEAQVAVEDYIVRMSRTRSCCIKIVHGRGINSPGDKATLKESLQRLLSTRRMSRYVVAYASAPSCDGGVGAVYVLLRRQ